MQPTSLCVDVGNNAAVPSSLKTDLAGNLRIVDYPGVHDPGAIVDMGAYELGTVVTITGTSGNDVYYVKLTSDGSTLQIWNSSSPTGLPMASYPLIGLASVTFNTLGGNDSLIFDVSNGAFQNLHRKPAG